MHLTFPTAARTRAALKQLREARADPDRNIDQKDFDQAWSAGGTLAPDDALFQEGSQPHQVTMAAYLDFEYAARSRALEAVAKEREGYLTTFVLLTAAMGLVAQKQLQSLIDPPFAPLVLVVPTIALVMLLDSHASKLSSHLNNYEGPGRRAARVTNTYLLVNEKRKALARRNAELQHAKRNLAVVCLLYQVCIVGLCGGLVIARVFG